jgi:nucleoside-diphosphate kinase
VQRTFAIIKPDAVAAGNTGRIIGHIESSGFKILAMRKETLTRAQAEGFYAEHKGKGFYAELIDFMTEGPVVLLALEREDAVAKWREVMGSTDPAKAAPGTIRQLYGSNIGRNAAHGSAVVPDNERELNWFFRGCELG